MTSVTVENSNNFKEIREYLLNDLISCQMLNAFEVLSLMLIDDEKKFVKKLKKIMKNKWK